MQAKVILLERQHIVSLLFDDGLGDISLASHRINSHHGPRQIQLRQQTRNRGDFIGFVRYRLGCQDDSRLLPASSGQPRPQPSR